MTIAITGIHLAEDMGLEPNPSIYHVILSCILFQAFQYIPHFIRPKNLRLWHQNGTKKIYIHPLKKYSQGSKFALTAQKRRALTLPNVLYMK